MIDLSNIEEEIARAERFEHPDRLMRLTLECGHYRLMSFINSLGGIGFSTACNVCTHISGSQVSWQIVNQEETGCF